MKQNDWLSAEEVAKEIKVSAMTIKRNCQAYSNFLKVQQGGKNKYLIHRECIPVFQFIAKMRNKRNLQTKQIIELLSKEGFPEYIDVEPIIQTTKQQTEQSQVGQEVVTVQELDRIIAERVSKQLKKHEESLKEWLTEQQQQQQEFQKVVLQKMDERDQNLMSMIRETQETKKLIAATQQKKWWQFWKK